MERRKGDAAKVRVLLEQLTPRSIGERVRFLVTEMPWDFLGDEQLDYQETQECQIAAVDQLVVDLLRNSDTLASFLPPLSRGQQRMAAEFGRSLARRSIDPLALKMKSKWPRGVSSSGWLLHLSAMALGWRFTKPVANSPCR